LSFWCCRSGCQLHVGRQRERRLGDGTRRGCRENHRRSPLVTLHL